MSCPSTMGAVAQAPARAWNPDPLAAEPSPWRDQVRGVAARYVVPSLLTRSRRPARHAVPAYLAATLTTLLLSSPLAAAVALVEEQWATGVGVEEILLCLIAPAARRLGDLWLADRATFLDVTRGTMGLQALLRQLGPAFEASGAQAPQNRAILLVPVPGEQHVLGLSVLACVFRRAGWYVALEPRASLDTLEERLDAEPFDVVGLSASGDRAADSLPAFAVELRARAPGRRLPIIAGGPIVSRRHAAGLELNVDGVAADACEAVALANRLASVASVHRRATASQDH